MHNLKIQNGWKKIRLDKVAKIQTGIAKGKTGIKDPVELPYLRVANVQDGYMDLSEIKNILVERSNIDKYLVQRDDIVLTEGGDFDKLGRGTIWREEIPICLHQNHVFVVRTDKKVLDPHFFSYQTASPYGKWYFLSCAKQTTNLASINSSQLKEFPVLLPPIEEQRKITEILSTWDEAIRLTQELIAAKQQRKKGLMQRLLTGQVRFPGFAERPGFQETSFGQIPIDWQYVPIGKIAHHISKKNTKNKDLTVLSCTKYDGLVDSLKYFGRQIFSDDTSTYKVVKRGQFAYATNHIEEGSIGYQSLYDEALISPMYTVFETNDTVNDSFLYRVLKTELYRHIYEISTNGTVNRRGSLRWPEFSNLKVPLPSLEEQERIAEFFNTCDHEIQFHQQKLAALQQQKKGLMQRLLTGQVRVAVSPEVYAHDHAHS